MIEIKLNCRYEDIYMLRDSEKEFGSKNRQFSPSKV
jgi:hypothetical protein